MNIFNDESRNDFLITEKRDIDSLLGFDKESNASIKKENPKEKPLSRIRTSIDISELAKKDNWKEILVPKDSILGSASEGLKIINDQLLSELNGLNVPTKLNGLITRVNELIFEQGIIPSKGAIIEAISRIDSSTAKNKENSSNDDFLMILIKDVLLQTVATKKEENGIIVKWLDQSIISAGKRDDKDNGIIIEQEFCKLLVGSIFDYRTKLPPSANGALSEIKSQELKKSFNDLIEKGKISVYFNQVGASYVPVIQFTKDTNEPNQAKKHQGLLYGSSKTDTEENLDNISPGRFFSVDLTKKEVPMISSISIVGSAEESPEIMAHELEHAAIEGQRKTQQQFYIGRVERLFSRNSHTKEALIRYYLQKTILITEIPTVQGNQPQFITTVTDKILSEIIIEIRKVASEEEIQSYIDSGKSEKINALLSTLTTAEDNSDNKILVGETSKLLTKMVADKTTGDKGLDDFLNNNEPLKKVICRFEKFYPSFINPLEEALTNSLSAQSELQLSDLNIEIFDNQNLEHIGSLILMRLLNKRIANIPNKLTNPEEYNAYISDQELLVRVLRSYPEFRNGKVIPSALLKLLSESKNKDDLLYDITKDIFPEQPDNPLLIKAFIEQFNTDFPNITGLSDEQITLLYYLTPKDNISFALTETEKGIINTDKGLGHAINGLGWKAAQESVRDAYGGKILAGMGQKDIGPLFPFPFNTIFHQKELGPASFRLGSISLLKTLRDGFGWFMPKGTKLDSTDGLEALGLISGFNVQRWRSLEKLRKDWTKEVQFPETWLAPSIDTFTNGISKQLFEKVQMTGGLDMSSAILLLSRIYGYDFSIQGAPTLSPNIWRKPDEYRNNLDFANFINTEIPEAKELIGRNISDKIGVPDTILHSTSTGEDEKQVNKFLIGQMSNGYLLDIVEMMVMGDDITPKRIFNPLGREALKYKKDSDDQNTVIEKRLALERIGKLMMEADYESNHDTSGNYLGKNEYTLRDFCNAIQMAEMASPGALSEPGMQDIYKDNSFVIKIGGNTIGDHWDTKEGKIKLSDAKEFVKYAMMARAERVMRAGVWGKDDKTGKYTKDTQILASAKIQGAYRYELPPINNFSPEQLKFFFGEREEYTHNIIDASGTITPQTIFARKKYSPDCGYVHELFNDHLNKTQQGKELSFKFAIKLLQADRYREFSTANMEFWDALKNYDHLARFLVITVSAIGALVPGMTFLINPELILSMIGWSLTASPIIERNKNAWLARLIAAIEAQDYMLAVADRFNALANEDNPPSYQDLALARSQFETLKFKFRSVLVEMSKNAKWDTNIFTSLFSQLWGKVST